MLLKARDIARQLNVTERYIHHLARENILPHIRVGRTVRFEQVQIDAWIAHHRVEGKTQKEYLSDVTKQVDNIVKDV